MKGPIISILALTSAIPLAAAWAAAPAAMQVQVVDERGMPVRDAVVELDPNGGWRGGAIRFPGRAAMAQKNVAFVPGTIIVGKGTNVAFPNLDTVRHSVYSFSKAARFEIDLYGRDQTRSHSFPVAGTVALGCNIHDQMRGYVRVVDTPYAGKTDQNGIVRLSGMAPGAFQLTVWHARARTPGGEVRRAVTVGAGQGAQKIALKLR
ncbi:MAG: methylamine utilization protein [Sphingopyxis sp.]|uniref:methylamine utilization protein n=1 Tax=Sphingopyxis sp. TaxID=1908224 RepID=UPI003D80DD3B